MEHLLVATFKSIRDELLANTIETGAVIVQTYIPGVSENTLCLPYRNYVKSEGYIENDGTAKGFVISPWSGKSPNPDYVGDLEVLYEDVNFRFKSEFRATNCTITPNSNNTLLLGSNYKATVAANTNYKLTNVTVNGTAVAHSDTTATINLDNILGDVIIIAEAELNTHTITYSFDSTCVESSNTSTEITHGETYITTLSKKEGYATLGAGNVTVGGILKDSWNEMSGSKQISVVADGDIVITAACGTLEEYPVTLNAEGCVVMTSPTGSNPTVTRGDNVTITLEPTSGYTTIGPGNIKVGNTTKDSWDTEVPNRTTTLTNVTGPVTITVTGCGSLEKYTITLHAGDCVIMNPASGTKVERGSDVDITLTPNTEYEYSNIGAGRVTVNGVEKQNWNAGASQVDLHLENVDGNIEVYADCGELNKYSITYKYLDTQGNQIHSDDVVTGIDYGTMVDVTQKRIPIEHYTFTRQSPDGSVVITQDTDVVLTYTGDPKYDVTVKYVNQEDVEIADRETITGKYEGDEITNVTIKTIEDYNYDSSTSTPLPFTVTNDSNQNIIYVKYIYDPGSVTLTVNYVDDLGGSIPGTPSESRNYTEGTLLTPQQLETSFKKVITGYEYSSGLPSTTLVMDESKTITLVYTKLVTLTVEYQDENGDPIPNQQSETHVYPRGTELDSSDLAEFIRTIENYTYDSTIPSSVTMSQDLTVVIKYTLNQQCIELDPEFGIQSELIYEGEKSVEITYHTLINGVPQEVHEDYSVVGKEIHKDLQPGEDDVYDTLNNLYGNDFKGYIIGTINGCDGDVNFKIYVIHCTENCIEVKMDGCAPWNTEKHPNDTWNTTTFTFSETPTTGQYGVFNLLNGVRTYKGDHPLDSIITKYTENMTIYDSNDPSNHVYWIKFGITYDNVNYSYIFIPVCEYYVLTTSSVGSITSSYINSSAPIDYFRKGDDVIIKHKSTSTGNYYNPDVFYTIRPKSAKHGWIGNSLFVTDNLEVIQNNAFREDDLIQDCILLKSWETKLKEDQSQAFVSFVNDNKERLGLQEGFTIELVTTRYHDSDNENGWYFMSEESDLSPILLKQDAEWLKYEIYPNYLLKYKKSEQEDGDDKYIYYNPETQSEEIWYIPRKVVSKCSDLSDNTIRILGGRLENSNQDYVFPTSSYYDIFTDTNGDELSEYTYTVNSYANGLLQMSCTSEYLVFNYKYSPEFHYSMNTYIIPLGMTINDFLPDSGDETILVDGGLELSKNKLSSHSIKNLGSKINVYLSKIDEYNTVVHEVYDLNGDIYLLERELKSLPDTDYCLACYTYKGEETCVRSYEGKYEQVTKYGVNEPISEGSNRLKREVCDITFRCNEEQRNYCYMEYQSYFTINILNPCGGSIETILSEEPHYDFRVYKHYGKGEIEGYDEYEADVNETYHGEIDQETITNNVYVTLKKESNPNVTYKYYSGDTYISEQSGTIYSKEIIKNSSDCETPKLYISFSHTLPFNILENYHPIMTDRSIYDNFNCYSVSTRDLKSVDSIPDVIIVDLEENCEQEHTTEYYLGEKEEGGWNVLVRESGADYDFKAECADIGSPPNSIMSETTIIDDCCKVSTEKNGVSVTFQYHDPETHILICSSDDSYLGSTFKIKLIQH